MSLSKINKAVVLSDISELYNDEDLLKLIEESNLRLILLASKDNLSETLVSRCNSVFKLSNTKFEDIKNSKELTVLNNSLDKEDREKTTFIEKNSPQLLWDMNLVKSFRYRDRMINIIANLNERRDTVE